MKNFYLLFLLSFSSFSAQKIEKNIFNNFEYKDVKSNFSAKLEKDIFENIVYTDNNQNKIFFEKKYVTKYLPELFQNDKYTARFFRDQVRKFSNDKNYEQKFQIDIFDKEILTDNRNNSTQSKIDIFGN